MKQFLSTVRRITLLPTLSFIFAFFIGGIIIVISDPIIMAQLNSPGKFLTSAAARIGNSYLAIFQGSIYDVNLARESGVVRGFYPLSETIVTSIPLVFAGLAVALAFRSGLFNIGAQGQFIFGAIGASYVGFTFDLPPLIHVPLVLIVGIIFGGLFGGIVGLLKAKTGAHEVIVTIMLNYVAALFILWLLKTSIFLRPERFDPIAPDVNPSARLPKLLGADLRLHIGIFIALAITYFVWWLLNRSTLGFKFRAVGANANAAKKSRLCQRPAAIVAARCHGGQGTEAGWAIRRWWRSLRWDRCSRAGPNRRLRTRCYKLTSLLANNSTLPVPGRRRGR